MQARKCTSRISLFLLSLTMAAANAAWAYPEYRVTVVGPANSRATDINSAGAVVGTYPVSSTATHGFLNRGEGFIDLGTLGGRSSNAVAINNKGQVLGNWTTRNGEQRGFIYNAAKPIRGGVRRNDIYYAGKGRDIGALRGRVTTFTDINNAGYVTAIGATANFEDGTRSYLRAPDGRFTDIGNLRFEEPTTINNAVALNNRNQIAGESGPVMFPDQPLRAFLWNKGAMRDLGDLGHAPNRGAAINDRGQVTGYASLNAGVRDRVAFLYSNGRLINIDGRPATTLRSSAGTGINNHGHIVGVSDHLSGFVYRGRRMQSLNALVDPALGWDIQSPQAINDAGQIAATAVRRGVSYAVRLDLIRPQVLAAPEVGKDGEE